MQIVWIQLSWKLLKNHLFSLFFDILSVLCLLFLVFLGKKKLEVKRFTRQLQNKTTTWNSNQFEIEMDLKWKSIRLAVILSNCGKIVLSFIICHVGQKGGWIRKWICHCDCLILLYYTLIVVIFSISIFLFLIYFIISNWFNIIFYYFFLFFFFDYICCLGL